MLQTIAMTTMVAGAQFFPSEPLPTENLFQQNGIYPSYSFESALNQSLDKVNDATTEPNFWFDINQSTTPISDKLIGKLISFLSLEKGWDGFSGESPSDEAVKNAIEFIQKLNTGLNTAIPMLSSDGEIGLFWRDQYNYIDIGFYGDGKYSLYASLSNGEELLMDDVNVDEELNEKLVSALSELS